MKEIGRNHDEEKSKEGSATETSEETTRRVVRRDALGGCVRNVADAGGAFTRDALRGSKYLSAAAPFVKTAIRSVRGGEAPAGSGGSFVRRRARAGMGIPAKSRGAARRDFSGGAEG